MHRVPMIGAVNTRMSRTRAHLQAGRQHFYLVDQCLLVWPAPEVSACIHTNSKRHQQGSKHTGVQFNQTKQGWCECNRRLADQSPHAHRD